MKLKNAKDWRTTLMAVIGGALMLAGILWPDTIDATTGEVIKEASMEILTGIGGLITVITGILAKDK